MSTEELETLDSWRQAHNVAALPPRPGLVDSDVDVLYTAWPPEDRIGLPGSPPYTRGVYPAMYRDRLWQMRLYSGFGDAESTNERWRFLLAHGNNGVSAAFDLPTQCGLDSDNPAARSEVGRVGVAVDSASDFTRMFDGLPVREMGISLNAHSTAPMVLAHFLVAMERMGVQPGEIAGSMTTDVLKDYVARGTWVFPPRAGIRLVGDVLEFCNEHMPRFYPLVIRGPDMRDAGATALQEVAFAFANAIAYLDYARDRGIDLEAVTRRISAQFYYYGDFLQEAAKTRAARRLWYRLLTERYGITDQKSLLLRVTASVGGTHFQATEPEANIVRGTLGCLGAVLGGCQGMLLAGYDEAYDIPTEHTARLALRTQQIVGYESDATATADPLGGSYFVESITDQLEECVVKVLDEIEERGGAVAAIESGYMQREITRSAVQIEREEQTGGKPIVGVNIHQGDGAQRELQIHQADARVAEEQWRRLEELRAKRSSTDVEAAREQLVKAAQGDQNLLPYLIDAARVDMTLGEMVTALRGVFGEFVEPSI